MNKQLSTPATVAAVVIVVVAALGLGWYMINRGPAEIGPKPGAQTGFSRLGGPQGGGFMRSAAGSSQVAPR